MRTASLAWRHACATAFRRRPCGARSESRSDARTREGSCTCGTGLYASYCRKETPEVALQHRRRQLTCCLCTPAAALEQCLFGKFTVHEKAWWFCALFLVQKGLCRRKCTNCTRNSCLQSQNQRQRQYKYHAMDHLDSHCAWSFCDVRARLSG